MLMPKLRGGGERSRVFTSQSEKKKTKTRSSGGRYVESIARDIGPVVEAPRDCIVFFFSNESGFLDQKGCLVLNVLILPDCTSTRQKPRVVNCELKDDRLARMFNRYNHTESSSVQFYPLKLASARVGRLGYRRVRTMISNESILG